MSDEDSLRRPVGWWLKEADARLDAAFDRALGAQGVDRRRWQVLATVATSPRSRAAVVSSLASFDEPAAVEDVIEGLTRRGWVEESNGALGLTPAGARTHAALRPLVERVRRQVAAALPGDDYATLVRLLAQLVAALPEARR
jgi:DNA-binding MarR family transcriptional regulator